MLTQLMVIVVCPSKRTGADVSEHLQGDGDGGELRGTSGTHLMRFLKECRERTRDASLDL